jgi:hypothetical protein
VDVDPESPEWTIAWSLKQNARTLLGPRADRVPVDLIAKQVIGDLRRSNWRLIKIPPELPAPGSPESMREAILDGGKRSGKLSRICCRRCFEPGIRTNRERLNRRHG